MSENQLQEVLSNLLDEKLSPIKSQLTSLSSKINTISSDLAEIRHDLGYENLKVIKRKGDEGLEEM